METLTLILAIAALVVALVALLAGGILTRSPRVRSPDVVIKILDVDVNCNGKFSGSGVVMATYPPPPPDARDAVEVRLFVLSDDDVTVTLGSNSDTFSFRDNGMKSFVFTGKLNDPCKSGTFQIRGDVIGTRLTKSAAPDAATVSGSGFAISPDFPGEGILEDELNFNFSFTVRCCLARPGVSFKVSTMGENNVVINTITNGLFPCPVAGATTEVTIQGTKANVELPGSFLVSITDVPGGAVLCRVGLVRVE